MAQGLALVATRIVLEPLPARGMHVVHIKLRIRRSHVIV
jgi:hypothetical protein